MYELIQGHGRTDLFLYYATTIGDFERVVEHWILEEEWGKAIDVINRQVNVPRKKMGYRALTSHPRSPIWSCTTVLARFLCGTRQQKQLIHGYGDPSWTHCASFPHSCNCSMLLAILSSRTRPSGTSTMSFSNRATPLPHYTTLSLPFTPPPSPRPRLKTTLSS